MPLSRSLQLYRVSDIKAKFKLARPTLYKRIHRGLWTRPVKLGAASVWPVHECETIVGASIAGKGDDEIRAVVKQLESDRLAPPPPFPHQEAA